MDEKQELKVERFWESSAANGISREICRKVWQACLEANGIGSTPSPALDDMLRDFCVRMQKYNQSITEWAEKAKEAIDFSRFFDTSLGVPYEDTPTLPEGFFRIGEEVDARGTGNLWHSGKVGVLLEKGGFYSSNIEVRRKPAWRPKDGEAVLFRHRESVGAEWKTALGTFSKGRIYFGDHRMSAILLCLKPFDGDYEQIGKPWATA